MAISASEIVYSVRGMSGRPEFYSGRGATTSDLDGNRLYAIYQKIEQELGSRQAEAFVSMVKELKVLSATNFLNALYALEENDWNLTQFNESNIDVGPEEEGRGLIALATVAESLFYCGRDDTEYIRSSFLSKIGFEREQRERQRLWCCDDEYEK